MKSSGAKKASITVPAELERDLRKLAKSEKRTLSGIIQEAARYYINIRQYESLQKELALKAVNIGVTSEDDVVTLIRETRNK